MSSLLPVPEVSPADARARAAQSAALLDCREHAELRLAKIDGATHIPMDEIPRRLAELDPSREWIVFCHHGGRSLAVSQFLLKQGFPRVSNLSGGIDAWSLEVDPAVPRY